jgi:hypothetical protein
MDGLEVFFVIDMIWYDQGVVGMGIPGSVAGGLI